jgi:hypothetical protein
MFLLGFLVFCLVLGFRLRVILLLGLFGLVTFVRGTTVRRSLRAGLLGVVRHIPSRPFELDRRGREQLLNRAAALWALLDVWIRKFLNLFEAVLTLLTLVFVKWHQTPETR